MVDLLQQYSIKSIINPYPVEWVHPKCLRDNSIGCKLLSLALEYADESVLRVLVEHEITKGTTAKACSSQDLTVESFFFFFSFALHCIYRVLSMRKSFTGVNFHCILLRKGTIRKPFVFCSVLALIQVHPVGQRTCDILGNPLSKS